MASETLRLRVRAPKGTLTISVAATATLGELHSTLLASTEIAPEEQDIRTGFPPKPLSSDASSSSLLASLGIRNGDTLIVQQRPSASSSQSSPAPSASIPPAIPGPARNVRPAPKPAFDKEAISRSHIAVDGGYIALRVVPDDNQCLFHATGMLLAPNAPDPASKMRQDVARAVQGNPVDFSEVVLGRPPSAYAKHILDPKSWGGAIELAALSAEHKVEIASVDIQSGRIDRYGEGQHSSVIIVVYSGIHYDAISLTPAIPSSNTAWPYDLGFDVLAFGSDAADMPLAATLELARKLKDLHYYTDTATFALRCEVCAKGLVGEKEAKEHVKQTGHASFTEYS